MQGQYKHTIKKGIKTSGKQMTTENYSEEKFTVSQVKHIAFSHELKT